MCADPLLLTTNVSQLGSKLVDCLLPKAKTSVILGNPGPQCKELRIMITN